MKVETIASHGWDRTLRIANQDVELIVTLDVGPRILSYRRTDGANVFKVFADQLGTSGEPEWVPRGGHRLWTSPEDLTRTYAPDNGPVAFSEPEPGVVRITQPPDELYGVQKEIDIRLDETGTGVRVVHRVTNVGTEPTELAVWALSVMAPGGVEIIPLPPRAPHPGSPKNAKSPEDFAPVQTMILWPFSDLSDPRYRFGSRYLTLSQAEAPDPTKIGLDHRVGWVAYLNGGELFVKRFARQDEATYPDRGANFETFTNADMLEVETLGPLLSLAPCESAEHKERWSLHATNGQADSDEAIDRLVRPIL